LKLLPPLLQLPDFEQSPGIRTFVPCCVYLFPLLLVLLKALAVDSLGAVTRSSSLGRCEIFSSFPPLAAPYQPSRSTISVVSAVLFGDMIFPPGNYVIHFGSLFEPFIIFKKTVLFGWFFSRFSIIADKFPPPFSPNFDLSPSPRERLTRWFYAVTSARSS